MSQCPDCGCDLPDSQALCKGCYEARYTLVGQPQRSKSFCERLTRSNILSFLGIFALGFLEFRFDTRSWFLPPGDSYRYHTMTTETAALTAVALASLAFWVESGRGSIAQVSRIYASRSEEPHANAELSNNGRFMYKSLLLWLLGEATAGAFFYAFLTYMPDFAKAIIIAVALVGIWCDGRYLERARKYYATPLFWLPIILGFFCGVVWRITGEDFWERLGIACICVRAVYRVIDWAGGRLLRSRSKPFFPS
jgi:hypothetical protein